MNQNAKVWSERGPVIQPEILETNCEHAKLTTSGFRPPSEGSWLPQRVLDLNAIFQESPTPLSCAM
jgi:hypothetical protein